MIIIKNRKKFDAITIFETVTTFIQYLKEIKYKINYESSEIQNQINIVYNQIIYNNDTVPYIRLNRRLYNMFKFKYRNIKQLNFWCERGWNVDQANQFVNDSNNKTYNYLIEYRKTCSKDDSIFFDGKNYLFKYNSVKFYDNHHLTCNECQSPLMLQKFNINGNKQNIGYYIIKCSNPNCPIHNLSYRDKYRAYLPKDVYIEKITKLNESMQNSSRLCVQNWLNKGYSENEAKEKISELQSLYSKQVKHRTPVNKQFLIDKNYSDEDINVFFRSRSRLCDEYWLNKGYSEDDAKEKISEIQAHNSQLYINKRKIEPWSYSAITSNQLGYWINQGCSEDDAKEKLRQRQTTFTLEKCITKYGDVDGQKIYTNRQIKWSNSLNKSDKLRIGYSKISQDLFYILLDSYSVKDREYIYFATKNKEFRLNKINGGVWLYDFADIQTKKIIEYNGDYYHANPNIYKCNDIPHPFRQTVTAKQIWDRDNDKRNTAIEHGFQVLIVWDSEYRKYSESTIKKCIDFLIN